MRVHGRQTYNDRLSAFVDATRRACAQEREELLDNLQRADLSCVEVREVVLPERDVFKRTESGRRRCASRKGEQRNDRLNVRLRGR